MFCLRGFEFIQEGVSGRHWVCTSSRWGGAASFQGVAEATDSNEITQEDWVLRRQAAVKP